MRPDQSNHLPGPAIALALACLAFNLAACTPGAATPVEDTTAGNVVIAEVLGGVQGNNLFEYIELYNPLSERVDLTGWTLYYQLNDGEESIPLYSWQTPASMGPGGSLLLIHAGTELGAAADATFEQGLNLNGGGLRLADDVGNTVDQLAWGSGPEAYTEGLPAPALQNGLALERLPGGEAGYGQDTGDNQADFTLQGQPTPRNTGSGALPEDGTPFRLVLTLPSAIAPGDSFPLVLELKNETDQPLEDLQLQLPVPAELEIIQIPAGMLADGASLRASLPGLPGKASHSWNLLVRAPWTYLSLPLRDVFVRDATGRYAYASPAWLEIQEGVIPISVSRDLIDSMVKVEGRATMYTGGYFAGSGNVKFYLQDESGGVQVWVPSGEGSLSVGLGDRVQVTGEMQLYRSARELVAAPETVIILGQDPPPTPEEVSIQQASLDTESLPGQLVSVSGTASRIEEFSYSYEVDLTDASGSLLTLYIDKLTEMGVERLELGREYSASGILEVLDSTPLLYPRIAADLVEIFPEEIVLSTHAPLTTQPGVPFDIRIEATNHTLSESYDLNLLFPWPQVGLNLLEIGDGGMIEDGSIRWLLPSLDPAGGSASVSIRVSAQPGQTAQLRDISLLSPTGGLVSEGFPAQIFLGDEIPIWAIQGTGEVSPYKLESLTTSGIVTGVFPELGGLWIQSRIPDDDPVTSDGLFIACSETLPPVESGDLIQATGVVREIAAQTQLAVEDCRQLQVLASGLPLPTAQALNPPVDDAASRTYNEALEGMLVSIDEPAVVIGPSSRYGETFLLLERWGTTRLYRGDPTGAVITLDDGSDAVFEDRTGMTTALAVGDQVRRAIGPLAYTFGAYKIEPIETPDSTSRPLPELPEAPSPTGDQFSLMTWNVENLFDILAPHPSSPPRPRKTEYELHLEKIARTLITAGTPSIVALQEVENLGILEDLAALELLRPFSYHAYLLEGTDSRGIDVGYLVREDVLEVLDLMQFPAPEGLTSRPPLALHVRFNANGQELVLFNNHFLSLSAGETATLARRTAQAAWNASLVEAQLQDVPGIWVGVLGDLNSFFEDAPIAALRASGLRHVFDALPAQERYTYVFQGISQTLDHILISEGLWDAFVEVEVLHLDADYPPPIPGDPTPWRKSDHDPVVALFDLAP